MPGDDPNPILDDGNPTSTGIITTASYLCDLLGIPLSLDPPRMTYSRGWGIKALDPSPVICSWTLTLQDINGLTTHITFDLFDDRSPLTIDLDLCRYARKDFLSDPPLLTFHRPTDNAPRSFPAYIRSVSALSSRSHVDILGCTSRALLSTTSRVLRPMNLSKRLHLFIHAPVR